MKKKEMLSRCVPYLSCLKRFKELYILIILVFITGIRAKAESFSTANNPPAIAVGEGLIKIRETAIYLPITGKVTNNLGEAIRGATVRVKGTTEGTQTDSSGNYSIDVPENATLVFSYVGYENLEVVITDQSSLDITLVFAEGSLEQVVVIGYGTQRKRDLTGSITTIKGSDIAKMPNINPISSLQGMVPGLTIVNSGTPGASPTVRIRGVNSVNTSNPVYVVDGIFQTNIDYLNMADIESIEVLRDPSSIAIFGLQAGSGVIVVTTKRAAKGQTNVSFQSSYGLQKVINTIDVTNAEGFKQLYDAQLRNLNAAPFDYTNYTWDTDWQKEILRTAALTNNSLTISSSSEKTTTLISLGHNFQEGVVKYGNYQRFVARLNEEIRVNDRFKIGADLTGSHWISNNTGVNLNNALWAVPIVGVRQDANTYYSMPSFQRSQVGNPVSTLERTNRTEVNKGYRVVGSIYAELEFLEKFRFRSQFYADLGFNNSRGFSPLPFDVINLGEDTIPTTTFRNPQSRTGVNQRAEEFRRFQQDHTLNYTTSFGNSHQIAALAGFTTIYNSNTILSGNRTDTTLNIPRDPAYWYIGVSAPENPGNFTGTGDEFSSMGFFGRVNYTFQNRYLLNASFRRDGISALSPANRWGNFGGIGVGWVISDEAFFDQVNGLDFLKIRGAWGTIGNGQGIGNNLFRPLLTTAGSGVFGQNIYPSYAPEYIPDSLLGWEVVRGIDIGIDFRALNNKLSGELTYYDRQTNDIITTVTLPGSAGPRPFRTNLGNISNKGVELSLIYSNNLTKDITYGFSPNFSYNRNRVVSIGDRVDFQILGNENANRTISGESIGHFYGYRQTGIYQSTADLEKTPAFPNSLPGDISYADLDGDGVITPSDREILGSPFPEWNFGFSFSLAYKRIDFLVQGQGVAGNYVYTQRRTADFAIVNYEANRLDAWTAPGTSNVEPIINSNRGNNFLFSSYYLEPGDYFRLRTIQLGYNASANTFSKIGIKTLRFYLSGQNVQTWTKTTGYSPEAPITSILAGGADNGVYPIPAIYTIGINATF